MTDYFLEERLTVEVISGSTSYGDEYNVEITEVSSGREHRRLRHPIPRRYFDFAFIMESDEFGASVFDLYSRVFGKFAGFRVKAKDDFTTHLDIEAPEYDDQELVAITAGSTYQLVKRYGEGTPLAIGRPIRSLFKPVAGTVLVGIRNPITGDHQISQWSVDNTTGVVTMSANKTRPITGITQAPTAVLTVGSHAFLPGEFVHISGVSGMTQINGQRAEVLSSGGSTITVNINTSTYSAYTSGGTANTNPQSGETVLGGCEFDIPCRFNARLEVQYTTDNVRTASGVELVELIEL